MTPSTVSTPLDPFTQGSMGPVAALINQSGGTSQGGSSGSQGGNTGAATPQSPAGTSGAGPATTGGYTGTNNPSASQQTTTPGTGSTGDTPNSTAELFSPAQVTSGGLTGQPGTPFNVVQPTNGISQPSLGYPLTYGAPPVGGQTLIDQDVEPPLPSLAFGIQQGLLAVGPPPKPLTFDAAPAGGAEEPIPAPAEDGAQNAQPQAPPQAQPQAQPPAEGPRTPAPEGDGAGAAALSADLAVTPPAAELPATWRQVVEALLVDPVREEQPAERIADEAVGSWTMGLALAGLALESRTRDWAAEAADEEERAAA